MAGAGIEVRYDKRAFAGLLTAPAKAAAPDVGAVAGFMGEELRSVGNQAFAGEVDPGSGAKWKGIRPRGRSAARYGRGLLTFTEP